MKIEQWVMDLVGLSSYQVLTKNWSGWDKEIGPVWLGDMAILAYEVLNES